MQPSQDNFLAKLLQAVREALSPGLKILYISQVGSQVKNLASSESGYEVKVVVVDSFDSYLLQHNLHACENNTTFEGKDLKIDVKDVINVFDNAINTRPFMIDLLRGIPIYKESDKLIEQLRSVFFEGYLASEPINAFKGVLFQYLNKDLKNSKGKISVKVAVDCIYLGLELRCLFANKNILDYQDIDKLMEFAEKDEEFIRDLIAVSRNNENEEVPITEKLKQIVQNILNKTEEFAKTFTKETKLEVSHKRDKLRKEVEKMVLEILHHENKTECLRIESNPMQSEQDTFSKDFLKEVQKMFPANIKFLYISQIGSKARKLASSDSDYDVNFIVIGPTDGYLLKSNQMSYMQTIRGKYEGKDIEARGADVIRFFDYTIETSSMAMDLLRGTPIYRESEKLTEQLRYVYGEGYHPLECLRILRGKLSAFVGRGLKDTKSGEFLQKASAKAVVDCICIVLEMRCLLAGKGILDYYEIDKLMEFARNDEEIIKNLVAIRRNQKNEEVPITEQLKQIIQEAFDKTEEWIKSFPEEEKQKVIERREKVRKEADKMILEILYSHKDS